MNKKKNSIFREELPGEKKSIVNLLMTGHIVTISCLGYMAFFLFIQLGQVTRIVDAIDANNMTTEQVNLLKGRVSRSVGQWQNEMVGLAIIGSIVSIIGGIYTINMVIRPLNKLVNFADKEGRTEPLPEFKSNTEIKQLATAITALTTKLNETTHGSNSPATARSIPSSRRTAQRASRRMAVRSGLAPLNNRVFRTPPAMAA